MNKYNERCGVDEVKRTKKPRKVVRNKDVGTAQATLHLLATGLASRTGCIHLVARDGTAATFDPFEGGRAEYAAMLLREYLALHDDAGVRTAVIEYLDELASGVDCEITHWEVPLLALGLTTLTPRYAETQKLPVGLTVTTGPDAETPAYEFACYVLDRYFGEAVD